MGPALLVVAAALVAAGRGGHHPLPTAATGRRPRPPVTDARPTWPTTRRCPSPTRWRRRPGARRTTAGRRAATSPPGGCKIPTIYAPPCVPVSGRPNGGATGRRGDGHDHHGRLLHPASRRSGLPSRGRPAPRPPTWPRPQNYVAMFNRIIPLDGRKVVLVPYDATGISTDAVAARADAIRVGQQIHAFASIGGPAQTPAYEDELARLHVLCLDCGLGATYTSYQQDAPYLWGQLPTPDTLLNDAFRYVFAQLENRDAIYAGEAKLPPSQADLRPRPLRHEPTRLHVPHGGAHQGARPRPICKLALDESYLLDLSELPVGGGHHRRAPQAGEGLHRHLRRRPDHADLPDRGLRRDRVLPRVGDHRHRVHRHVDPGPLLRPEGVGPRLRHLQPGRAHPDPAG